MIFVAFGGHTPRCRVGDPQYGNANGVEYDITVLCTS